LAELNGVSDWSAEVSYGDRLMEGGDCSAPFALWKRSNTEGNLSADHRRRIATVLQHCPRSPRSAADADVNDVAFSPDGRWWFAPADGAVPIRK
jgi:hypothetical protein